MKDFNKYFERLHRSTQYALVAKYSGTPISGDIYDEAIKNNPECFPEEVEHMKKWAGVPQEVKDKYFKETREVDDAFYNGAPHSQMGLVWYSQHPEECKERDAYLNANRESYRANLRRVHDKYLKEYGIKFIE